MGCQYCGSDNSPTLSLIEKIEDLLERGRFIIRDPDIIRVAHEDIDRAKSLIAKCGHLVTYDDIKQCGFLDPGDWKLSKYIMELCSVLTPAIDEQHLRSQCLRQVRGIIEKHARLRAAA